MKVTLIGVASTRNYGQMAMVEVCIQEILNLDPTSHFILHSYDCEADRKRLAHYPIEVYPTRFTHHTGKRLILLRLAGQFYHDLIRAKGLRKSGDKERPPDLFIRSYIDADLIIDLSGDSITDDYSPAVTFHQLLWLLLGAKLHKPTIIMAQSLGPFYKIFGLTRYIARKTLSRISLTTARESITYNYIKSLGIADDKIRLTGDLAFLLEPAGLERLNELLSAEGLQRGDEIILGVTPSPMISRFTDFSPDVAQRKILLRQHLALFLTGLVKKHGLSVWFIPHVTKTGNDDREEARAILEYVDQKTQEKFRTITGEYTARDMKAVIGTCDLFLGFRMHPTIAALSQAVPTISIAYSHKTHGIIGEIFGADCVEDIREIDVVSFFSRLETKFNQIYSRRTEIHETTRRLLPEIKARSQKNFDLLMDILGKNTQKR